MNICDNKNNKTGEYKVLHITYWLEVSVLVVVSTHDVLALVVVGAKVDSRDPLSLRASGGIAQSSDTPDSKEVSGRGRSNKTFKIYKTLQRGDFLQHLTTWSFSVHISHLGKTVQQVKAFYIFSCPFSYISFLIILKVSYGILITSSNPWSTGLLEEFLLTIYSELSNKNHGQKVTWVLLVRMDHIRTCKQIMVNKLSPKN